MTSWTEILKANKGLHARDSFSELWGLKLKAARAEFPDYTITGTLPLTFNSRAAVALKNYRIHGTSEGAGVETESGEPAGFKIPILNTSGVTENLTPFTPPVYSYSDFYVIDTLEQAKSKEYCIYLDAGVYVFWGNVNRGTWYLKAITEAGEFIGDNRFAGELLVSHTPEQYWFNMSFYSAGAYWRYDSGSMNLKTGTKITLQQPTWIVIVSSVTTSEFMITKGSTPPDHYIPHRYESNYDLFIGDSKLGEEEYVDYQEQKIYKMSGSTLVPTDPPVPLPPIPTYKGENTLSSTETLGEVSITGKITEMA